ncbi:DUF4358 domain-containing protein [Pseudoflavonifractor sp. An85]|uniref:DUF4358 domain-containing protein n=1 Tax=Pseudoflavonifractor sp. An85 TaxID=1965661 RepID=UPI000B398F0F|nr:DUF4358 domain-containing protein [Pseudoflavonifractor sp. An85]OUN19823.1 hypothetical protein B5G37_13415 [Pseudoflavonifractor sp. An85]
MRKKLALLFAALMAVSLVGCSSSSPKTPSAYTVDDAQVLMDAGVFDGDMAEIDLDTVAMLYDIDRDTIQDGVSYLAANTSVSADELTILVLTDEAAAQTAETACEKRLDNQLKTAKDYTPAAVPRLEGAVIRRLGNTVLLAVGDPSKLPSVVDQLGN